MKGLALETVVALMIGMASLLVLLMLFSGSFKPAANWFYCNLYYKFVAVFNPKISMPEYCNPKSIETVEIKESDNLAFSRILLSYIIACWKKAEATGLKSQPCYELKLLNPVDDVTEYNVTQVLIKEDHCQSIENSDYGCGTQDNIVWKVAGDVINEQTIILIEYNATIDAVEVIG